MDKTFLVIDGVWIEDMESNTCKVYEKDMSVYLEMISGRMVSEERGRAWVIELSFSSLNADALASLNAALADRRKHTITFLPPDGGTELRVSEFYLTSRPAPALASWVDDLPEWTDFNFVFEEVKPHD